MKKPVKTAAKSNGHAREISAAEAAAMIPCSLRTLQMLVQRREIKGWRLSDRGWWRIDPVSVERFLQRRKNGGRR